MRQLPDQIACKMMAPERGASMVEYALLVMLIAMIAVAALTFAGGEVSSSYSDIANGFPN